MYKPVVLIILDGWGIGHDEQKNVLAKAALPTFKKLDKSYPMTTLQASGISVGIPWGEPGNSEVGHITLGAGRIVYQNLPRITLAVQDNSFFANEAFLSAIANVKKNNSALHLIGLLGEGSVHSYTGHLYALLDLAKNQGLVNVFLHIFTDGRDSSPTSGIKMLEELKKKLEELKIGKIASVCGRNWAMDRNNNWDRTEKAYRLLTEGAGKKITDPAVCLQESYAQKITDEYIEPAVIAENEKPLGLIKDNDSVIFFNFREDRARQLTKAFVLPGFDKFKRAKRLNLEFVTMTEYEKDLPVSIAFPQKEIKNGLGEILSRHNLKQLRIAETEKYAHVTYFFNGGKEDPWHGEDRILIPSPAVSKFDESPEMSAHEITEKTIEAVNSGKYDFILLNYANPDMVAHTGNEAACILAAESVSKFLSYLIPEALKAGGCLLITADHGNIEEISNVFTGEINTEHSANPVPLWYITPDNHRDKDTETILRNKNEVGGLLSDIAPTILDIMQIEAPPDMSGGSLLPMLK